MNFALAFVPFVVSFCFHHKAHKVVFTKGTKEKQHTDNTDWTDLARIGFVNFALAFVAIRGFLLFNHKARKEDTSPCFGVAKTSLSYL